ncbi:MAG: sulfotransferase [Magnetococcales bacterium]|nr:sulfotransferase [Magnetococcales bacterium]
MENNTSSFLIEAKRLFEIDCLAQAKATVQKELQQFPDSYDGLLLAGNIAKSMGHTDKALEYLQKAANQQPDKPDHMIISGRVFADLGQITKAVEILEKVLSQHENHVSAYCNLIEVMAQGGDLSGAITKCKMAIWMVPHNADLYSVMARVLHLQKSYRESETYYKKVIELAPDKWSSYFALADLLLEIGRGEEAETLLQKALLLPQGKRWDVYHSLGKSFMQQYRAKDAVEAYEQGVLLKPSNSIIYRNLGNALREIGRFKDANNIYREGLVVDPEDPWLYALLPLVNKYADKEHPDLLAISALLEKNQISIGAAMELHFALGKALDQCKSYDTAFYHYQKANKIRYSEQNGSDLQDVLELIENIKANFTPDLFKKLQHVGSRDSWPVFIVGMFRSGTSLTEQILASHPDVHGAGERVEMGLLCRELPLMLQQADKTFPECIAELTPAVANEVAKSYRDSLYKGVDNKILRVVDKLPFNFLHLGVISLLFPNAHIIHCKRHPLDVCLSNYFQNFSSGPKFVQDLEEIALYYRAYHDLMLHWQKVLPLSIHSVVYEELVADPMPHSQDLIKKIALPWDDKCLSPHKTNRAVQTASTWQVRQPIYASSRYRWRNYEKCLGKVKDILEDLLPENSKV